MVQEEYECAVEIHGGLYSRELADIPPDRRVIRRKGMTPETGT
ncbi:MAG: hypothetical protein R3191_05520 [Anaerolineales bacterium]|nr:hypothetical protein [Anaerolineales bacterium]